MPLMGTKELCALLLGTTVGIGGTVTVQKTRPPVVKHQSKKVSQRAPLHKAKPPAFRSLPSKGPALLDCPLIGSPFSTEPNPFVLPTPLPPGFGGNIVGAPLSPPVWGGVGRAPVLPPPMIPEPGAWAMWIAGFGLIGLACRRWKAAA
jgi:hypothetical protein